jgi:hypothetical protein
MVADPDLPISHFLPMTARLLTIGSAVASLVAAFGIFAPSVEASFYYDESAYNRPIPCYQYDGQGHCTRSGARYNARAPKNSAYYDNGNYQNLNSYKYNNGNYQNSNSYNGSMYGNQYPYGYTNMDYGSSSNYRPVDNYYRSTQNNGCYWYYGSYRCDNRY